MHFSFSSTNLQPISTRATKLGLFCCDQFRARAASLRAEIRSGLLTFAWASLLLTHAKALSDHSFLKCAVKICLVFQIYLETDPSRISANRRQELRRRLNVPPFLLCFSRTIRYASVSLASNSSTWRACG